jgi:hypothetical protein
MVFLSFIYLILALQLYFGCPPFYGKCVALRPIRFATRNEPPLPIMAFTAAVAIFALILLHSLLQTPFLLWLVPMIAAIGGLSLRRALKRQNREQSLWFLNPLSAAYPLWLFDLWTLGLPLIAGLLILS